MDKVQANNVYGGTPAQQADLPVVPLETPRRVEPFTPPMPDHIWWLIPLQPPRPPALPWMPLPAPWFAPPACLMHGNRMQATSLGMYPALPHFWTDEADFPTNPLFPPLPYWRYTHILFGLHLDQEGKLKHIIFGVPGRYCLEDQPYQGMTGFTHWHPVNQEKMTKDAPGYWLIHYDPQTMQVVEMHPTPPPPVCSYL